MIVKMKFISITGPKSDIDRVVNQYLSKYEIHLENALSELTTVQNLTPYLEVNPYREDLVTISSYYSKLPHPEKWKPQALSVEQALEIVKSVSSSAENLEKAQKELETQQAAAAESLRLIRPLRSLDYEISSFQNFQHLRKRFGRIEKQYYQPFEKYVYTNLNSIFYKCDEDDQYVWGIYFVPKHQAAPVDAVYSSLHFERLEMPENFQGTGREAYQALASRVNKLSAQISATRTAYEHLLESRAQDIASARYTLDSLSSSFDVRRLAACVSGKNKKEVFYILCGWMSETDALQFQKDIEHDDQIFCVVEDESQNQFKQPPTKLKNPKLFRPFEMFIRMYGLPSYNDMDPTIFLGLTYSFIFGAMFGDVGQGLCLLIGGALLYRLKKIPLAAILSLAGIFSTIFGFLYGSFFGFEEVLPALWLHPKTAMMRLPLIGSMNTVFVVAIAFGMFLILGTMVLHIASAIHRKDVENVLFDQNALAGFAFYGSLVAMIFLYMTGHALPAKIVLIVMFGVPLLLIMLKEPLTRMISKKTPAIEGSKGMYFVQSFFEMFEVLLSYLSNTLSFVRIGAFAVSHAAMMEVVLMLAGAANGGNPNWIVIILGNIFVTAMEGLIVGIQVLRLEYYEMFSRFYSGSGREFQPFLKKTTGKSSR